MWLFPTSTQPNLRVKDSERCVLAKYTQPNSGMKDSEGWVLATCTQPNPRVKVSEGCVLATCTQGRIQRCGYFLPLPSLILE